MSLVARAAGNIYIYIQSSSTCVHSLVDASGKVETDPIQVFGSVSIMTRVHVQYILRVYTGKIYRLDIPGKIYRLDMDAIYPSRDRNRAVVRSMLLHQVNKTWPSCFSSRYISTLFSYELCLSREGGRYNFPFDPFFQRL